MLDWLLAAYQRENGQSIPQKRIPRVKAPREQGVVDSPVIDDLDEGPDELRQNGRGELNLAQVETIDNGPPDATYNI